jgi:hypothetical protein
VVVEEAQDALVSPWASRCRRSPPSTADSQQPTSPQQPWLYTVYLTGPTAEKAVERGSARRLPDRGHASRLRSPGRTGGACRTPGERLARLVEHREGGRTAVSPRPGGPGQSGGCAMGAPGKVCRELQRRVGRDEPHGIVDDTEGGTTGSPWGRRTDAAGRHVRLYRRPGTTGPPHPLRVRDRPRAPTEPRSLGVGEPVVARATRADPLELPQTPGRRIPPSVRP